MIHILLTPGPICSSVAVLSNTQIYDTRASRVAAVAQLRAPVQPTRLELATCEPLVNTIEALCCFRRMF